MHLGESAFFFPPRDAGFRKFWLSQPSKIHPLSKSWLFVFLQGTSAVGRHLCFPSLSLFPPQPGGEGRGGAGRALLAHTPRPAAPTQPRAPPAPPPENARRLHAPPSPLPLAFPHCPASPMLACFPAGPGPEVGPGQSSPDSQDRPALGSAVPGFRRGPGSLATAQAPGAGVGA